MIKLKGGWYCEYCHKVHCRRVYKYKLLTLVKNDSIAVASKGILSNVNKDSGRWVCSLGKDAVMHKGWRPGCANLCDRAQSALSTICDATQSAFIVLGDAFKGGK